jgi:hypothetical protein
VPDMEEQWTHIEATVLVYWLKVFLGIFLRQL